MAVRSSTDGPHLPPISLRSSGEPIVPEQFICVEETHPEEEKSIGGHAPTIVNIVHSREASHRCASGTTAATPGGGADDLGRTDTVELDHPAPPGQARSPPNRRGPVHP